jgi:hypothetical protein
MQERGIPIRDLLFRRGLVQLVEGYRIQHAEYQGIDSGAPYSEPEAVYDLRNLKDDESPPKGIYVFVEKYIGKMFDTERPKIAIPVPGKIIRPLARPLVGGALFFVAEKAIIPIDFRERFGLILGTIVGKFTDGWQYAQG